MMALAGCSSGDNDAGPTVTSTTVAVDVTVVGVVRAYSPSARILTLEEPVQGVTAVVVPTSVTIVRSDGGPGGESDLSGGKRVQVTGVAGTPGSLVAQRILLL